MQASKAEINRVSRAWSAVLDTHLGFSQQYSREEGAGMNWFKFLSHVSDGSNCHYYYVSRDENSDMWDTLISLNPHRQLIESNYNPDEMFLICVQVPTDSNEGTIGSIRAFKYDTFEEVEISFSEEVPS